MGNRQLSEIAIHGLIISAAAAGRWKQVGIEKMDALEVLQTFCRIEGPRGDNYDTVRGVFCRTQDALMAYRMDDFCTIQKEPPFSDFGMANLVGFLDAWEKGGDQGVSDLFELTFSDGWEAREPIQQIITLKGGNGFSEDEAVKIDVTDIKKRVRCEYWFLNYTFGDGCDFGRHMTIISQRSGKRFSSFMVTCPEEQSKQVFFDISDQVYER